MLEDIREDIKKLISLYENEKTERIKFQDALAMSEAENKTCRKQITELEQQIENLKLTEAFTASAGNNTEAKGKIEKMIREIDKCISLLGD
jgi:phage shock protein A